VPLLRNRFFRFFRTSAERGNVALLLVLFALSLTANIVLGLIVFNNRGQLPAPTQRDFVTVRQGDSLAGVRVHNSAGQLVDLTVGPARTLIYVFSRTCGWCEKNIPNMKALQQGVNGRFRLIAISVNGDAPSVVDQHMVESGLAFEMYYGVDPESQKKYGLGATPQTLVVSPDGLVQAVWMGAYGTRLRPEIERFFSISLPGLQTTASGQVDSLNAR